MCTHTCTYTRSHGCPYYALHGCSFGRLGQPINARPLFRALVRYALPPHQHPHPTPNLGATNRPQELDEAARRRFVKRLYIPLPDEEARRQLVWRLLSANAHVIQEADVGKIVKATAGERSTPVLPPGACC